MWLACCCVDVYEINFLRSGMASSGRWDTSPDLKVATCPQSSVLSQKVSESVSVSIGNKWVILPHTPVKWNVRGVEKVTVT